MTTAARALSPDRRARLIADLRRQIADYSELHAAARSCHERAVYYATICGLRRELADLL